MPGLQGIGQPHVLAVAGKEQRDLATGLVVRRPMAVKSEAEQLSHRILRFRTLREKPASEKRVAIIYYNHPRGRHNIGADNLDVPHSLFLILNELKSAGYDTGPLPKSPKALLALLQERGVNLPEDRQALATMASKVPSVPFSDYQKWFAEIPEEVQKEMVGGPLLALAARVERALQAESFDHAEQSTKRVLGDVSHVLSAATHPAQKRALDLLSQLKSACRKRLDGKDNALEIAKLSETIAATQIEGVRGWGTAPGRSMVHQGKFMIPGLQFGKVFLGPQPPRGWELDEELLHANLAFPPPHQYLAAYHYIRQQHQADIVIHLGRHSTAEFLPGHQTAVSGSDYPQLLLGDLPNARRRGPGQEAILRDDRRSPDAPLGHNAALRRTSQPATTHRELRSNG